MPTNLRHRLCFLMACLCLCMAGCAEWGRGGGVRMWAVPDGVTVFPDALPESDNELFSKADATVRLAGALNETVSFQLAFRSDLPAGIRRIAASDLRGESQTIPADRFRFYREQRIRVTDYPAWYLRLTPYLRAPRAFPDVLVPIDAPQGGLPIALDGGSTEAVWVDVRVPATASGGTYASELTVTTSGGQRETLKLVLEVYPFALPSARHLAVLCGVDVAALLDRQLLGSPRSPSPNRLGPDDPNYQKAVAIIDATAHLLHEHRCTPLLEEVSPLRRWDPAGQLILDWTNYDRLVASIVDGSMFEDRAAAPAWPIPFTRSIMGDGFARGEPSGSDAANLTAYLQQCADHFADLGWLERNFVWWGGTGQEWTAEAIERLGRLVHDADGRLRVVGSLPPQPLGPLGDRGELFRDVSDWVNIWAPRADVADRDALIRQRAAGRTCWLRPDQPPYSGTLALVGSSVDAQSLPWQAFRFGCDGILIEAALTRGDSPEPSSAAGERRLIWPGKPYGLAGPVPSIRLKRLARGIQDYGYLWMLDRNRRGVAAEAIAGSLFTYGGTDCYGEHLLDGRAHGWATDPAAWSLARRLMANELLLAFRVQEVRTSTAMADPAERLRNEVEWSRLTRATRTARLEVDGVRVRPQTRTAEGSLAAEVSVAVFNHGLRSVDGAIVLRQAPANWSTGDEPVRVQGLATARQTRRTLPIIVRDLLPNAHGVTPFEIGLDAQEGTVDPSPARFCLINALEIPRSLEVDGRLDDWPLGAGNTAGDFLLVGAIDVPKQSRPSPDHPSQNTTVFLCHDTQRLYVGFLCQDDRLSERVISRNNVVNYDGLWPTDEDLVEIVLDPTGRAVSPADLLHIVVKANGAVVTERGFACLDRVAAHEPLPGLVKAAVDDRSHRNRWTAEVSIDLNALPGRSEIMGINFGRYVPRLGEYSSWSGARRNLYSPICLGNLCLPSTRMSP